MERYTGQRVEKVAGMQSQDGLLCMELRKLE
jgi:hypothetical protein